METYYGHVRTPADAIILFEACRIGLLPRVQRRLSEKERQSIRSGSVFVWDEKEAGMRRWTDGKSWSASRVSGSFLTYREMEGKRGGHAHVAHAATRPGKTPDSTRGSDDDHGGGGGGGGDGGGDEGPDGYRYKPDGLMKQSFSITTSAGQHLHLISYYARSHPTAPGLNQPSTDPALRHIRPQKDLYPESSINDQQNLPVVTRGPMVGAGYAIPGQAIAAFSRPGAAPPAHSFAPAYTWGSAAPMPGPAQHQVPVLHYVPGYMPADGSHPPSVAYGHPPPPPHLAAPQPPHAQPHHAVSYESYPHHAGVTLPPVATAQPTASYPPSAPAYASSRSPQPSPHNAPLTAHPNGAPHSLHAHTSAPPHQPGAVLDPHHRAPSQHDSPYTHRGVPSTQAEHLPGPSRLTPPHPSDRHAPQPLPLNASRENLSGEQPSSTSTVIPGISSLSSAPPPGLHESSRGADHQRNGSNVNGETQATEGGPKDIPSEKIGFGEDVRALRQLDRVFPA